MMPMESITYQIYIYRDIEEKPKPSHSVGVPLCGGGSIAAPQSEESRHIVTDGDVDTTHLERRGRAMYFTKSPPPLTERVLVSTTIPPSIQKPDNHTAGSPLNITLSVNVTNILNNDTQKVEIIGRTTPNNVSDVILKENTTTTTSVPQTLNVSSLPSVMTNMTSESQNVSSTRRRNNLTRLPEPKEVEGGVEAAPESRIVTEKPLSLETALLQTRLPPNTESRILVEADAEKGEGMDTGAVAGISFAALALVALGGSTGFVLYRRRFLNKPQTLNDKCSNPDSSGYLDDSTVRENSEEMYSLDNDSFLNSLEAMTIQNYWTDTVKHTKL
ncbi:hypothetical protein EVAR_98065_1 [Eumeta japonica]|uniref:Uncharacterized protein n=1 Tax=Eumeta variegata TaxID=151549 RepID=A0A4C1WCS4_EUMVA|nr:hypothetical protein EVAR_98065_1 [Eumeta japonica]